WVPADRVLFLCESMKEAFGRVRARANLDDPDERLRLAQWCRRHGLRAQALAEVRAAVQMRPGSEETRRLLAHLEQAALCQRPGDGAGRRGGPEAPPKEVDLSADSLGLFATRVQPILMNTCANCHISGRGGAFQLTRSYDAGLADRM